ncbi:hypothetical protein JDV09_04050 [Mycobacterium sp. Y57]|uniref:hypothetical protein n=1 Tax=Mycolicibacterium xanthum TaxID=2796469 RepID=UPI001C85E5A1|nr:hypothetical protein [Mycolicibacterium xanthum]MBX7431286.1 hypothetical protein [Mycolicibacterium xanthum]
MDIALTFLILATAFAVAALLSWATGRNGSQPADPSDRDDLRVAHDLDAVRTRFEQQPTWPQSRAGGERR